MTVIPGDEVTLVDLPGRRSGDPLRDLPTASSMRLVRVTRSPMRRAHRHPASEEVVYVRRGTGTVYVEGVRTPVGPGTIVHIPAGTAHATIPDAGAEMELVCFFPHPDLTQNLEETDIDVMTEEP